MCGSKQSANWTTSTPSLPCSYSLLSNVLALFPHYTRPIKKEAGWRRCWWFMVFWECAYLFLWEHAFFMCVSGGHVIRCAVYLTSKNPKHLSVCLHTLILASCKIKVIPGSAGSAWGNFWGMLPACFTARQPPPPKWGLVGGSNFCHPHCWMGSPNRTSSVTLNGLPAGTILL